MFFVNFDYNVLFYGMNQNKNRKKLSMIHIICDLYALTNIGSCLLYGAISFIGNDFPFKVMRVMEGHKKPLR